MKEKIKVIVLFLILILFIVGINYFIKDETEKRITKGEIYSIESQEEFSNEEYKSKVITVSNETFEEEVLKSNQKVVIDFYADWCGPCKMFSPIFEKVSSQIEDVKFVRINVDEEQDLATKYKAYSIPYIVLIENGEVIKSHTGLLYEQELNEFIKGSN